MPAHKPQPAFAENHHLLRIIMVKHSLPEIDTNRPAHAWQLSQLGIARAHRLASHVVGYQPAELISSPEPKAIGTTEVIANTFASGYRIIPGLHEHKRPDLPFASQGAFHARIQEMFTRPAELVYGAETALQAQDRFATALNEALSRCQTENLIVVSHGTVISLWVSLQTGADPFLLWRTLGLPSYLIFEYPGFKLLSSCTEI